MLTNLVDNALRATDAGSTVTVAARADAGRVVFSVEDTGRGIRPEQLPRLFEKFSRRARLAGRRRRPRPLHRAPDCGSARRADLGALRTGTQHDIFFLLAESPRRPRRPARVIPMPNRILIVDDEPDLRTVMRLALEGRDYDLEEAGSGEEVLARLREGARWDVVVLDHRLPGIDGVQTLQGIREIDPTCTVLMVTAFASIDLAVEAMKLGARDFVQKPMTPETLRAAVATALSKARGEWVPPPTPLVAAHRAWEVWTMNGFHIVDARDPVSPVEHRYEIVQGRDGPRHPVTVRLRAARRRGSVLPKAGGRSQPTATSGCGRAASRWRTTCGRKQGRRRAGGSRSNR